MDDIAKLLNMMKYALIDESGRLYDPLDKILVFGVVVTASLVNLSRIIPNLRRELPRKGIYRREKLHEIKFSLTGDRTRSRILKKLASQPVRIYGLTVNKFNRTINDTPENYAQLVSTALTMPLEDNCRIEHILIDKHFSSVKQREQFNNLLQTRLKSPLFIEHLDSSQNEVISMADFAAGAIRYSYVHQDNRFRSLLQGVLIKESLVDWRELKSESGKL